MGYMKTVVEENTGTSPALMAAALTAPASPSPATLTPSAQSPPTQSQRCQLPLDYGRAASSTTKATSSALPTGRGSSAGDGLTTYGAGRLATSQRTKLVFGPLSGVKMGFVICESRPRPLQCHQSQPRHPSPLNSARLFLETQV